MRNASVLNVTNELLPSNKSKIKFFIVLMLCVFGLSLTTTAAPSDLDPAFGTGGKVISSPDGSQISAGSRMVLQADGKIVMIGNKRNSTQYLGIVVARFNADGSVDTTFGTNGSTSISFGGESEFTDGVDIQSDGKIVVGASTRNAAGNLLYFGIARLNSDGSFDTTFDGDGKVSVDVIDGFYGEYLSALKVGSDGKIVAAGMARNSGVDDRFVLTRLNSDGSLDPTFGTGGKAIDQVLGPSNNDRLNDMVILPDGTIIVVGTHWGAFTNDRIAVKFSANGYRTWIYRQGIQAYSTEYEGLSGVAVQPDGKILIVGKTGGAGVIYRLTANGATDTSFTSAGMPTGQATSVAVQGNGKILVNAYVSSSGSQFALLRFNSNGTLDTGFGNNGIIFTPLASGAYAYKVLIQPDGKYLLGGYAYSGSNFYFAMTRYVGEPSIVAPARTSFDYDGDGKADVSVFRPSENRWYIVKSSDSTFIQPLFGTNGDIPTPADYDGDGKTDIAIFRPSNGVWWYLSSINNAQIAVQWGANGDIPRPSNFDGDSRTDFVLYRPSNGTWYRLNAAGQSSQVAFGLSDDKPVLGDFDGDGKTDPAIFRPSTGVWWYAASSLGGAHRAVQFGISTDVPVPADYDGDGKTDIAVYRPSEGGWHILRSSNGSYYAFPFGDANDKPVPADYDGDGKADAGVYRPSNGSWYILRSTAGFAGVQWGTSTDIPTQNAFIQ